MVNPLDFLRGSKKKKKKATDVEATEAPAAEAADEDASPDTDTVASPEPVAAATVATEAPHDPEDGAAVELGEEQEEEATVRRPPSTAPATLYAEALKVVGRFFKAAAKVDSDDPDELPIADVEAIASEIVDAMVDGDELVALAVGSYPDNERFIVPHSVNVAILAQRVGRHLELDEDELFPLGVAALVHDVGTVRIAKEVFYKPDSLSDQEWEQIKQRPGHSREIILAMNPKYLAVAEIAYQVHERLDGKGYPRGLRVDEIALEASILGAVDIFEAFIHPRPYKKTVPAAAMYGVDNLMRMSGQFGDGVLKGLVRSIGLFPVGTHVKLNSGEVARVLKGREGNPMRPEVEVIFDTQNRKLDQTRLVDLMTMPHLYVFKPLSPEDLAELGIS